MRFSRSNNNGAEMETGSLVVALAKRALRKGWRVHNALECLGIKKFTFPHPASDFGASSGIFNLFDSSYYSI